MFFPEIFTLVDHQNNQDAMDVKQSILKYFRTKAKNMDTLLIRSQELDSITQKLKKAENL